MTIKINGDNSVANPGFTGNDTDTGLQVGTDELKLVTGGTARATVDSSGNVGISTTSAAAPLHVDGDNDAKNIVLSRDGGVSGRRPFGIGISGPTDANFRISSSSDTSGANAFDNSLIDITADGNVGIGTTSPVIKLDVNGAVGVKYDEGIKLYRNTGTTNNDILVHEFSGDDILNITPAGNAATSAIAFKTSSGSTPAERMRIDSSGNIGVNVISPTQKIDVDGNVLARNNDNTKGAYLSNDGCLEVYRDNSNAFIDFKTSLAEDYDCRIQQESNGLAFTTGGNGSAVERMRITSVGITSVFSSNQGFNSRISAASTSNQEIFLGRHSATNITNGTLCFFVEADGDVKNTNNSYTGISDIKLKENIVDANSQWSDIKSLQIRNYNFKPETNHRTHTQLGLIAQEVELVSPGLVSESPDRDDEGNDLGTVTKSVNYSVLYMKAVKALQEAMERIETLETQNADLTARITALETA